jgi:hypothetical protein
VVRGSDVAKIDIAVAAIEAMITTLQNQGAA